MSFGVLFVARWLWSFVVFGVSIGVCCVMLVVRCVVFGVSSRLLAVVVLVGCLLFVVVCCLSVAVRPWCNYMSGGCCSWLCGLCSFLLGAV